MPSFNGTVRADLLSGGELADILNGRTGSDTRNGDAGADRISGGEGSDTPTGRSCDDLLFGLGGRDRAAKPGDITALRVGSGFGLPVYATSGRRDPDHLTGGLYIADVGQDDHEEVNFQAAGSPGGLNYGWSIREGTLDNAGNRPGNLPSDSPLPLDPLIDYPHVAGPNGGFSLTGGYAYLGISAGMQGACFYADFVTDQIWSFRVMNGHPADAANRTAHFVANGGTVDNIAPFGEDGNGNLHIVGLDDEIFNDSIYGGAGKDMLTGSDDADRIFGGKQDDVTAGGKGVDRIYGGAGADVFVFNVVPDSLSAGRDVIADFDTNDDLLDFPTMDARAGQSGNQQFSFIGSDAFSTEGQIRAFQSASSVIVQVNTTGAKAAETVLILRNLLVDELSGDDFLL